MYLYPCQTGAEANSLNHLFHYIYLIHPKPTTGRGMGVCESIRLGSSPSHRRFCKFAVGVPNTATNLAVYGELGSVPLEIKKRSTIIKY